MKDAGHRLVDDVTKLNTGLIGRLTKHSRISLHGILMGRYMAKPREGSDISLKCTAT